MFVFGKLFTHYNFRTQRVFDGPSDIGDAEIHFKWINKKMCNSFKKNSLFLSNSFSVRNELILSINSVYMFIRTLFTMSDSKMANILNALFIFMTPYTRPLPRRCAFYIFIFMSVWFLSNGIISTLLIFVIIWSKNDTQILLLGGTLNNDGNIIKLRASAVSRCPALVDLYAT